MTEIIRVQKLGNNIGGYRGETVEIEKVLLDIQQAAMEKNWTRDPVPAPVEFFAWHRDVPSPRRRVYISTGIHGDEPAGPLAALPLVRENLWPADAALWLCPCLNPSGFPLNRRENSAGIDLNRDYRHLQSAEVRAHVQWLQQQPAFDLVLCLHEDWESHGFYLYELNPDQRPSLAESIIDAVAAVCPVDPSPVIEDRPAHNGIIRPVMVPLDRPQWPESLYLIAQNKTRLSYTVEAPSDFPLTARVAALTTAVRTALRFL
jgi:predicted deacylase